VLLAMRDDAVQRFASDLADPALAVVSAFSMDFIDLDQRLNKVAFVGIAGWNAWIFKSVLHLPLLHSLTAIALISRSPSRPET